MAIDRLRISDGRHSITRLVYGHNELVAHWVAKELKMPMTAFPTGLYHAIGLVKDNMIIAGVVYNNYHEDYRGKPLLIEMTIASVDKAWCTRHNLHKLFQYPFRQLGVRRVQATCSKRSKHVRKFLERLGFRLEGVIRQGCPHGGDAVHYSILETECRWIEHEQGLTKSSSGSRPGGDIPGTNAIQQGNGAL